jgi:hypothetical protein
MHCRKRLALLLIAGAVLAFIGPGYISIAAPPAATTPVLPRVRVLENRYFFHTYEQDPIEKRLQRLELLVYGQTKSGDEQDRLQHLNVTIAERDRESALKMQRQHEAANSPAPANPETSTNPEPKKPENIAKVAPAAGAARYPAVTSLEWKVLKKSYSDESLDDRLARLETKVFGQPSNTMSYADRVERLNRTLGIGAVASAPSGSRLRGPLPRTRPQTDMPQSEGMLEVPFLGNNQGFGFYQFSDPNQKQMSDLFKQMNQQMEQMMRMTPGYLPPSGIEQYPAPSKKKFNAAPEWKVPSNNGNPILQPAPPSYNDPNSI